MISDLQLTGREGVRPEAYPIPLGWGGRTQFDYIGSAEGHEYPNLQVGDEVNPRRFLRLTHIDQPLLLLK
jgi:hypothetical protein